MYEIRGMKNMTHIFKHTMHSIQMERLLLFLSDYHLCKIRQIYISPKIRYVCIRMYVNVESPLTSKYIFIYMKKYVYSL